MKRVVLILLISSSIQILFAQNEWIKKANYAGGKRSFPFGFSIGAKGYVGGGSNTYGLQKDFWDVNGKLQCTFFRKAKNIEFKM